MKKILLILLIITSVFTNAISISASSDNTKTTSKKISWPKGPSVVAESAIVMEVSTGLILYQKNMDEKHYPASITKILTTLLAIENSSMSEIITFSKDAVYGIEAGSSNIGAMVGENLTMEQSLYAIMLESANEVSSAVAEHIGGSVKNFCQMMNEKAKELGCTNTHFVNANGLHSDEHYTTAHDMALISQAAMKNSTFRTITGTKRFIIEPTNKYKETRYLTNHQQMLCANKYPQYSYDGCIGGKTGYTNRAGNTLVTFAKKGEMELVCVVMKSKSPALSINQYTDSISLLDFGFSNFTIYNIADNSDSKILQKNLLFSRYNSLFDDEVSPLKINGNGNVVLPNTASLSDATQSVELFKDVTIKQGENRIGSISYKLGNRTVGNTDIIYNKTKSAKLVTVSSVKKNTSPQTKTTITGTRIIKPVIIIAIVCTLLIVIGLIFIYLFFIRKKRRSLNFFNRKKKNDKYKQNYIDFNP